MNIWEIYTVEEMEGLAKARFEEERKNKRLDGWFRVKEIVRACEEKYQDVLANQKSAMILKEIATRLQVDISEYAIFVGTQDDAFARSYALINPAFQVDSFTGYCDPVAVFDDIEANEEYTIDRINENKEYFRNTSYARALEKVYEKAGEDTREAVFFVEQVTGHMIPDFRTIIAQGVDKTIIEIQNARSICKETESKEYYHAMELALEALLLLAKNYSKEIHKQKERANGKRRQMLALMESTLSHIPHHGARNLYEAIQFYLLLWQLMCIEQSPNPFAFSVGNADRIFEPYRSMEDTNREESKALFEHFLVFFNVGDRSWAISQNIILGGMDREGKDLTNLTTYGILDAFYGMNLPQPILSVKLHKGTPSELYENLGKFFFTPGCLTPSLFYDNAVFKVLKEAGIAKEDLSDYAIAGCQEPLIMGKDNGNTTNSWLNLGKILELTLHNGYSSLTEKKIGMGYQELGLESNHAYLVLKNIRSLFYQQVEGFLDKMVEAANDASRAISLMPVPFLSVFMGGIEYGADIRDSKRQGSKYNGSGCLIHGLSVIADSFTAIDSLLKERPEDAQRLLVSLWSDFEEDEEMRQYLLQCNKFGNAMIDVDEEAAEIVKKISDMVGSKRNYLGNRFRPDWSTPSTHLIYGYKVGATPDGRRARQMLGYGIDPLYGNADSGMGLRILSCMQLPFEKMTGGYASHFGISPNYFKKESMEERGIEFYNTIIKPLFLSAKEGKVAPFYLYVNVTTPEILQKVLDNPSKYAPGGIYIMRIHGTFVNFLDLSAQIQQDIIKRLDLRSTSL